MHALRIIGAMPQWLRAPQLPPLPLIARAPLALLSVTLLLWSGGPVVAYPFTAVDAGHYSAAIGRATARCAHDPVPAPSGCWSARTATVTITGVDHTETGDVAYAVLEVPGREQVRSDLVSGVDFDLLTVGSTVTVRYWGGDIAQVLPAVAAGSAPVVLPTRDNPSDRAAHFPATDLVSALLALMGSIGFGASLWLDLQRWRGRRGADAAIAVADPGGLLAMNRGLARYGMVLQSPPAQPEATLAGQPSRVLPRRPASELEPQPRLWTGHAAAVRPAAAATPQQQPQEQRDPQPPGTIRGGNGWNIRRN
jgi:hypothetical protein